MQITTNVLRNLDSASMEPPVNEPGHPPDVTAQTITKEIDVTRALRGSREMSVMSVVRGSRVTVARNVFLVSKVMTARDASRAITETTAVIIFIQLCFI